MIYNPFSLEGKTVLITGASSGIGKAAALECSKAGAKILVSARNYDRLLEVYKSLDISHTSHPNFVAADLSTNEGIDNLVNECPNLDGAFINAGISNNVPVKFINREKLDEIFNINVFAPILLIKSLLKSKKINKGASIVFTSSVSGNNTVTVAHEMYSATKTAITGFMKNLALDLANANIRVNAINPGMVNTPMVYSGKYSDEQLNKDMENYPLKRFGCPEEIGYAVIYLLSNASSWVTGHSLVIDGGLTLK